MTTAEAIYREFCMCLRNRNNESNSWIVRDGASYWLRCDLESLGGLMGVW